MIFFVILIIIFTAQSVPALPQQKPRNHQICTDYDCFAKLKNANQLDAVRKYIFGA